MKTFSKFKQVAQPQHSRKTRKRKLLGQNKDYLKTSKQSSKKQESLTSKETCF